MAISLTYTFVAGTRALASQVNSNFSTLSTRALDKTGDTMTGNLLFTDATYDIGATGATRPRDFFLSRNATIGGTLGVTGVATFTAAPAVNAGIQFPATQAASADANNLDDYEENTWTPTDGSGAALSLTVNSAQYVKIGQLVMAVANITYPVTADGSNARINGFPFTSQNTTAASYGGFVTYTDEGTAILVNLASNGTFALFYNVSGVQYTNANLSGSTIRFVAIYRASA